MEGLRKRPTYNQVVDYLENEQPKIKYPDRRATFLRNSPYLSQFDGDSWIDLEEQESNITKEQLKEAEIKRLSAISRATAQVLRTEHHSIGTPQDASPSEIDRSSLVEELEERDHIREIQRKAAEELLQQRVRESLQQVGRQEIPPEIRRLLF
jgi:hypothetical protein